MKKGIFKTLLALTAIVLMTFTISTLAEAGIELKGPWGGPGTIFPYIIRDDPNVTTLISIMVPNPDGSNNDAARLHYSYFYKDIDAADTDDCAEYDFGGATSPNDLVTFDVGGIYGGGLPMFGDTTSDPRVAGSTFALTVDHSIGYLLVEVLDENAEPSGDLDNPDGEAIILDIANGGSWSYKPYSGFRHRYEQALLPNDYAATTTLLPVDFTNTTFIVTPLNHGLLGTSGAYDSRDLMNQSAVVQLIRNDSPSVSIFDRNENTMSATKEKKVTCIGIATLDELLSQGILNNPTFIAQGGWGYLWNKPFMEGAELIENDAWVYKVESGTKVGRTKVAGDGKRLFFRFRDFFINGVPNGGYTIFVNSP